MEKIPDYFLYLIIAALLYILFNSAFNAPVNRADTPKNIELSKLYNFNNLKDPEQNIYINLEQNSISIDKNNSKLTIYPRAIYRIYAMVMSKTRYYFDWNSNVAPYDLALAWNELMLPENQKDISYTQSNRWYYFQYGPNFPLSMNYIVSHSANTHIIPANQNVLTAIDRVRNKEKIYMEGFLVNIKGTVNGRSVWWNSSLTRNDSGDGACEVFYVKRAVLDGKVYE